MTNRAVEVQAPGQSIWQDFIEAYGAAEDLAHRGWPLLRVHLGKDVRGGVDVLASLVRRAVW